MKIRFTDYAALLFVAVTLTCVGAQPGMADSPAVAQSHYPVYSSPIPLTARRVEFAKRALPAYLTPVPRVKCPLYIMEYHIWWRSPFGPEGRPGYAHWDTDDDTDTAHGAAPWIRHSRLVGYPVPGLYNSLDEGVIRWQLQCMHNAGVDGVFVQLFPEWDKGQDFLADGIWRRILRIADQVGIKVAAHDEVQFRDGSPAQTPDVMAQREGNFIKQYGSDPAYLKIDGKPAIGFQFWDHFAGKVTNQQMFSVFKAADQIAGRPIFWLPYHAVDPELLGSAAVPGSVVYGNSGMIGNVSTFYPPEEPLKWSGVDDALKVYSKARAQFPNKQLGLWGYPGFNNASRPMDGADFGWLPRWGGRTLVELLRRYVAVKPSFVILSSWNDWEENTAMEPGLRFDGYAGDPYLYCRILAATKGQSFTPPALPPKESVDPWLWQVLYGIKHTPPVINAQFDSGARRVSVTVKGSSAPPKAVFVLHPISSIDLRPGDPQLSGIAIIPPAGAAGDVGVPLAPNKAFTVTAAWSSLLAKARSIYAGVEILDTAPGSLEITYPAHHQFVQYDPRFDEVRGAVMATVTLNGTGRTLIPVRLLRDFDTSRSLPKLTLTWRPDDSQTGTADPVVLRVDLLPDSGKTTLATGWPTSSGKSMRNSLTLAPSLDAGHGAIVYLFAQDRAGNASAPIGVATGN